MNPLRFVSIAAATLLALAAQAQTAPKIDRAWARPTVPGQAGGGGFLRITGGAAADRLVGASSGVSRSVELHTMELEGSVMRMRPLPDIEIPAGQPVELAPGGKHLMFVALARPLRPGDRFPLTLRFEKAGEVTVEMQVMMQAAAGAGDLHRP